MRLTAMLPLWGLALAFFASCTPAHLTREGLIEFIADRSNGLYQTKEANRTLVEVSYRPTDLMICQELGKQSDTTRIASLRKKYAPYYYFVASFSRNNKEILHPSGRSFDHYSDLVQNMSFRMPEYVRLTTSADTIPVADFMLNRTFGLSASTEILFAFNKEKTKGMEWVRFNLKEFGLGTGNQWFIFSVSDLENVPRIQFESDYL